MVGAAIGVLLGVLLGTVLSSVLLAAAIALIALAAGVFFVRKRIGWGLFLILLGAALLRTALIPKDTVQPGVYTVTGTVAETPEQGRRQTEIVLKHASLDGVPLKARISLTIPKQSFAYGDTLSVVASVQPPKDPLRAANEGICTEGEGLQAALITGHHEDAYGFLIRARAYFSNVADWLFEEQAASAKGMLLGDRSELSRATEQLYADNGILHLFAVSGLHMTVLMTLIGTLFRSGKRGVDLLVLAALSALYCALTRFTPSVMRAALYLLAIRLAILSDRQPDPPSAYCFSFTIVLLIRPYSLFTASFLLSFAAMAGIVLLTDRWNHLFRLPPSQFLSALFGALSAFLGVLPVQAYFFDGVAWMAIPMSVLLSPFLAVFMPVAFLVMLLAPLFPLVSKVLAVIPRGGFLLLETVNTFWNGSTAAQTAYPCCDRLLYRFAVLFRFVPSEPKTSAVSRPCSHRYGGGALDRSVKR